MGGYRIMQIFINVTLWTSGFIVFCAIVTMASSLHKIAESLNSIEIVTEESNG